MRSSKLEPDSVPRFELGETDDGKDLAQPRAVVDCFSAT